MDKKIHPMISRRGVDSSYEQYHVTRNFFTIKHEVNNNVTYVQECGTSRFRQIFRNVTLSHANLEPETEANLSEKEKTQRLELFELFIKNNDYLSGWARSAQQNAWRKHCLYIMNKVIHDLNIKNVIWE